MNKKTNKTAQVLRLLTGNASAENPIIHRKDLQEGEVPPAETVTEPSVASAVIEEVPPPPPKEPPVVDVVSELVNELLPIVLERFGCGECSETSRTQVALDAAGRFQPCRVCTEGEEGLRRLEQEKKRLRSSVTSGVLQAVIAYKRSSTSVN